MEELDVQRKLIYVRQVDGKMEVSWPGDFGEINTRILERMRRVLAEDTVYPYLKPNARHRLEVARHVARNTGMTGEGSHCLLPLGGYSWCLFPWLGTRSFRTLRKFLQRCGGEFRITAADNSPENIYIQRITLNGEAYRKYYIDYAEIAAGGELRFEMGPEPADWTKQQPL